MKGSRLALLLAVLSVLAAACSGAEVSAPAGPTGAPGSASSASSAENRGSGEVPDILNFTAPELGGGRVVGADYAGKDLAMWFWAPW